MGRTVLFTLSPSSDASARLGYGHTISSSVCAVLCWIRFIMGKHHIAWDGSMLSGAVRGTAVLCQVFFWGGQPLQALHPLKWGHRSMGQELLG